MSSPKARRNSTIIERSKYAAQQPPADDRRQRLASLGQDSAANQQAKREMEEMAQQHRSRPSVQLELEDISIQKRQARYTVAALAPAPAEPEAPAQTQQPEDGRGANTAAPAQAPELPAPKAKPGAPRRHFEHIEHQPVLAPKRDMSQAQSPAYPRQERYERPAAAPMPADELYGLWGRQRAPVRIPLWMIMLAAVASVAILWMFAQSPKTFISAYGGLPLGSLAGNSARAALNLPQAPIGEHTVLGEPSITAAAIDAILAHYGSPAAGTGQAWVKIGREYQIDPAYALAFFIHESGAGTNPGWAGLKADGSSTHNIGNIICAGYATCYGRFRDYPSWDAGIDDWYKLIDNEYVNGRGAFTVEQIIPIYAPASDNNNVPGYVQAVVGMVDSWRQGVLQ